MASRRRSVLPAPKMEAPSMRRQTMGAPKRPLAQGAKPKTSDDFVSGEVFRFEPIFSPQGPMTRARRSSVYFKPAKPERTTIPKAKATMAKVTEEKPVVKTPPVAVKTKITSAVATKQLKPTKTPRRKTILASDPVQVKSPLEKSSKSAKSPATKPAKSPAPVSSKTPAPKSAKSPVQASAKSPAPSTSKTPVPAKTPAQKLIKNAENSTDEGLNSTPFVMLTPLKDRTPTTSSTKKATKTPATTRKKSDAKTPATAMKSSRKIVSTPISGESETTKVAAKSTKKAKFSPKTVLRDINHIALRPSSTAMRAAFTPQAADPRKLLKNSLKLKVENQIDTKVTTLPAGSPYTLMEGMTENGSPAEQLVKLQDRPRQAKFMTATPAPKRHRISTVAFAADEIVDTKPTKRRLELEDNDENVEKTPKRQKLSEPPSSPLPGTQWITGDLGRMCVIM